MDTIVALSSGRPPAAIAVIRVSGAGALGAAKRLAGSLPPARRAGVRTLRDADGVLLDRALVLVFGGPASATGEDLVELHCHGGRAVIAAVEAALIRQDGLRAAEPGEFTRRALLNGRIDLAEAEGLADLLEAETEAQRRVAVQASEGGVSREIRGWLDRIVDLAARVEAIIDFGEDEDVVSGGGVASVVDDAAALRDAIGRVLSAPPVERVRDGVRIVIGGPPNSGKSTLLNLMTVREASIVSPHAGTTRDRVEAAVQRSGVAYLLTDTAGLTDAADPVERIGVARAHEAIEAADVLIWLADTPPLSPKALWVHARADLPGRDIKPTDRALAIRQDEMGSIEALWDAVAQRAAILLPTLDDLPLKHQQRLACAEAAAMLSLDNDPLIAAEQLRIAARVMGKILGIDAAEVMLDALFSRFCLGK